MSALQPTRKPATRQAVQHIVDMLAGVTLSDQQTVDILSALADAAEGSAYCDYGSVSLAVLASIMQDETVAFETPEMCGNCSGTGEGLTEFSNCRVCNGRGEHPSPKEVAESEKRNAP